MGIKAGCFLHSLWRHFFFFFLLTQLTANCLEYCDTKIVPQRFVTIIVEEHEVKQISFV